MLTIAALASCGALFGAAIPLIQRAGIGRKTVDQCVAEFGPAVYARLAPAFKKAGVVYPPERLVFVGLKTERELQVCAAGLDGAFKFIKSYPILGASGTLGPKLRQGDGQVPEGVYAIGSLNPNRRYHLSLRISYPNGFDLQYARREHRTNLGGDIMIHGGEASEGCLAVGDEAAEDLFVLAAWTGLYNIRVVLCPMDFRDADVPAESSRPAWVRQLYCNLNDALESLPRPAALSAKIAEREH